jgi:poly(A)-specific ribonuclease
MHIPFHAFSSELVKIIHLISDSHFIALDLEFSGIASHRGHGGRSKLSLQEAYEEVKEAARQYQVLQVGLTIVEENPVTGT